MKVGDGSPNHATNIFGSTVEFTIWPGLYTDSVKAIQPPKHRLILGESIPDSAEKWERVMNLDSKEFRYRLSFYLELY